MMHWLLIIIGLGLSAAGFSMLGEIVRDLRQNPSSTAHDGAAWGPTALVLLGLVIILVVAVTTEP